MPIATLAELFAAGGQHTIEQVLLETGFSFSAVTDALRRRFGESLQLSQAEIEQATFTVREAVIAGRRLHESGETPGNVPQAPTGQPGQYTYHIVVQVPDPLEPENEDRSIEVPITVPSPEPLDLDELRQELEELLQDWQPPRDTIPGGPASDLIRRDVAIRQRGLEFGDLSDIFGFDIVSIYRSR